MKVESINQTAMGQAIQNKSQVDGIDSRFPDIMAKSNSIGIEESSSITGADFTHMTRRELLEWGKSQQSAGNLSPEGVDAIWSMGLNISGLKLTESGHVERTLTTEQISQQDNKEKVNFISFAQERINYAESLGENKTAEFWQQALSMMQNYQGSLSAKV